MRLRLPLLIAILAGAILLVPATASAYFVHVVASGESLSSIAAADGLGVDQLAAANGLSPDAQLVAGSTVQIPPQGPAAPVASTTGTVAPTASTAPAGDGDADTDDTGSSAVAVPAVSTSGGSYVVQPGDTLSAIAGRAGTTVDQLAALNGLDPNSYLISGTALRLSGASGSSGSSGPVYVSADTSSGSAASAQPVGPAAEGSPTDPPYPTPERVSAPQVGSIAAADGVPASLADAIAWQESGFNNDLVSSADARGVMQILPGTWQWIQSDLNSGGPPLAPASAADNVRGGVLMLHSLLDATGGDSAMAAASYYQGLSSVQQHGMYPDTQQYVHDVLSLESQFGGGG